MGHSQHREQVTERDGRRVKELARINPRVAAQGLLEDYGSRWFWVWDDDDWEIIKDLDRGQLRCPLCDAGLTKPIENKTGRRFLRRYDGVDCGHALIRTNRSGGRGGVEGPEHRWYMARLRRVMEVLGVHEVFLDDHRTGADLWIPEPGWVFEVQRWATDAGERTKARFDEGACGVCWFVPGESPDSGRASKGKGITRLLFRFPSVRLFAYDRNGSYRDRVYPWINKGDSCNARLGVQGTVARKSGDVLSTSSYDAAKFIDEIFADDRVWLSPPVTRSLPTEKPDDNRGLWVLRRDLSALRPDIAERLPDTRSQLDYEQHTPRQKSRRKSRAVTEGRPLIGSASTQLAPSVSPIDETEPALAPAPTLAASMADPIPSDTSPSPVPTNRIAPPSEKTPSQRDVDDSLRVGTSQRSWWRRLLGWR